MTTTKTSTIEEMFSVGAHYGFVKSRRHPSAVRFIFGSKNSTEVYDLEKTLEMYEKAKEFAKEVAKEGKSILFVGGKHVARESIKVAAESLVQPYVAGRWIGGTLTNSDQILSRVERLKKLREEKEKGDLDKYTKKERLLIDREIAKLEDRFGGLVNLDKRPSALFVVDSRQEVTAVKEAQRLGIKVIALAGSDNNIDIIDYPIPANDANPKSSQYFVDGIAASFKEGLENVISLSEAKTKDKEDKKDKK